MSTFHQAQPFVTAPMATQNGTEAATVVDFSFICEDQRIFDVHAEVSSGVFNLAVAEQDLHGIGKLTCDGRFTDN
jgi:hypothetical protein